jgi:hypothetical protein
MGCQKDAGWEFTAHTRPFYLALQVKALAACAAAVTAAQGVDASAVVWFVASDSQQGRAIVARHAASHGIPVRAATYASGCHQLPILWIMLY